MFIHITTAVDGLEYIVKRSDIRRVYPKSKTETFVCFNGTKNSPITVAGSPADFYRVYIETKA